VNRLQEEEVYIIPQQEIKLDIDESKIKFRDLEKEKQLKEKI